MVANRGVSVASLRAEVTAGKRDLERFREDWDMYHQQLKFVQDIQAVR